MIGRTLGVRLFSEFKMDAFSARMQHSITRLKVDLDSFRVGRANPALLDKIKVEMGGRINALANIAQINVKDAHTLVVNVSDEEMLKAVDKAIRSSPLGLNPQKIDATALKVPIPKASDEYKETVIKSIGIFAEKARVSIRGSRGDARKSITATGDLKKNQEKLTQTTTDKYIREVDAIVKAKQKELELIV